MEPEGAHKRDTRLFPRLEVVEKTQQPGEQGFRLLSETISQIAWTARPDGTIDYYNQHWYDFTGHTREETLQPVWWLESLHPDDRAKSLAQWESSIQSGEPGESELRIWDEQQRRHRWFLKRITPISDPPGKVIKWFVTCTDIDNRKQAEELPFAQTGPVQDVSEEHNAQITLELYDREQQLQSALDLARLGVWKVTIPDLHVSLSVLGKNHLGFPPETDIDYDMLSKRIFPADPEKLVRDVVQALNEQGVYEAEHQIKWADGSTRWIAVSGQGQYAPDNSLLAVTGVTLDITTRKLESERKDTFIGMASHELKTPITTVKGFTQLLQRQLRRLGMGDQITTLNKMEEQINSLNRLVGELLDVTKIQAGKLEYNWTDVDLDELLKNAAEICRQGREHHAIKIRGAVRRTITGDRTHLEQVFNNLIINAIKYSPQARRIDIWKGQTQQSVTIKIRDYGIGIPTAELEHIFDRFYRVNSVKNKAIQGLGMGLYIAREIIEQHGGKIHVESQEGEGSTFCVELPFSSKASSGDSSCDGSARSGKSRRARGQPG